MSRYSLSRWALFVALVALGCAKPEMAEPALLDGPHGGAIRDLGSGFGYAEFLNSPAIERGQESTPTSVVVYYLGADGKTSMTPAPTEVSMNVVSKEGNTSVPLKAGPDGADPAGGAKFASETGPYALGTMQAVISGQREGKVISFETSADR